MIWIAFALILLLAVGCTFVSAFVGWQLTHPVQQPVDDNPGNVRLAYEEIGFRSRPQDVELKGWFLPARGKPASMTIILSHGYAGTRLEKGLPALSLAKSLVEAGYNVLMYDFRNSGLSGGSLTTVGYLEKQDLLGAIDWVRQNHPGEIGLVGFSMGATTSILAAAEEPDVLGVVADSPFSRLKPYLQENLSVWSHLPKFPFTQLILTILPPLTGIRADEVDAFQAVDKVYPRPVLFIHSQDDDAIPYTNSESMWTKHQDRFQFWKSSKAGHVGTYRQEPQEYTSRVLGFFANLQK